MEGNGVIEAQDQTGVDSRFQVMGAVNCTGAKSYTIGKWTTGTPPIVRCNTGLGPSDYFGRTMVANLPTNIKVGVVPVAIGGCDIALFDKVNYGAYVATAPTWMIGTINQYGGNPYARLVEVAKLAQKDGVIKGILFHQGETNNGQQDWPTKVKAIYDNLIKDLGLDPTKTPFLAGELVTTAQGGACGGHNSIIAKLPNIIPNSYVVSAAGLPHKGDNLHFTPASYRTLGQRYAQLMLTLLPKAPALPQPPIMGWASWNQFGANISENTIKGQANAMVSSGLSAVGYKYINIDDGFFDGRNTDGSLKINAVKFPNGMKSLADYIHSKDLKAGFYSEAGSNTCGSKYSGQPGGVGGGMYNHDQQDANLFFKTWGFDFLKVDYCGAQDQHLDERTRYTAIRNAILNTGEEVNYNVCRWQFPGTWVTSIAESWRMSTDINFSPGSTPKWDNIVNIINLNTYNAPYSSPGHYNDMDMLEVGRGLPFEEDKSHFSMWCMLSSPLLLGCDMTKISNQTKSLLTNQEVIAVSQDTTGPNPQAQLLSDNNGLQVWVKKINGRQSMERAVVLFNQNTSAGVISVKWKDLNIVGSASVRDLWAGTNLGSFDSIYSATVPAHGVLLLKVVGTKTKLQETFEGEYAWLNNYNLTQNTAVVANQARAVKDVTCSRGAKASYIGNGTDNFIEFRDIYAETAGKYTLTITYQSGENRGATLRINGKDTLLTNLNSGSFSTLKNVSFSISLIKGYNILRLTNSSGWIPDIDKIHIDLNKNSISAPVVSITAPTNNTVYTEGDNVTINATATITTGSISKVDFYNGTTLLGSDASSPYTYTISAAAAGNYAITAKATSALNAATTSTAVNIQVAKSIYQTGSAPVIDGTIDALWSNFNSVSIAKNNTGTVSSTADLSGNWKAAWDATNLYVLVQVTDDVKRNDAGTDVYNDDGVEVYIDMGNSKTTTYGTNDQQYTFRWNDATAAYEINGHSVTGITKGITNTTTGYIVEVSIPWITMGGTASVNAIEGFEVMISDDDDGAARDGKMAWAATTDDTWSNPSLMGTVILKGLNCTAPTAAITTTTSATFCAGGSVVLNASTGTGYSYVWKNGTTTITGATAQTYTATTAGTYTVTITNSGGCSATSTATTVTVNALPTITQYAQIDGGTWNQVSTGTVCAGSTIVLGPQPTVATGWSWTGPNGYSATTREITLASVTPTQGGVYTAMYTDGNTCKATSTFTVTVNAAPTAAITTTTSTTFCAGGSTTLTASSGSSYKWMNGTIAITGATAQSYTATTAGSYTVEVTNAGSCKATSAATTVTVNAAPTAAITTTTATTFCAGGSVVLTANSGSSYKWMNGTTAITGATAQSYIATTAGSYTVEVTNAGSCKATSAATTVTVNAAPTAAITANGSTSIPQGGSVVLTANTGSGFTYKWFKGSVQVGTAQTYTATDAGVYTVEVTNANNCSATSSGTNVNINTNQPSVITITSPAANTTVQGTITIAADVTDPDGTIVAVEFLDGNMVIGTSTTAPYSFDWSNPGQGTHVITVRVRDSNGGITTSAPVTITSEAITTGVQSSNTLNANIYPNPSNGIVFIDSDTDLSGASCMLVDVMGIEMQLESTRTGSGAMVDVSNLSAGTYVFIINSGNSILRKKITIIK